MFSLEKKMNPSGCPCKTSLICACTNLYNSLPYDMREAEIHQLSQHAKDSLERIRTIFAQPGANPDETDLNDRSALHIVASTGNPQAVKYFLACAPPTVDASKDNLPALEQGCGRIWNICEAYRENPSLLRTTFRAEFGMSLD